MVVLEPLHWIKHDWSSRNSRNPFDAWTKCSWRLIESLSSWSNRGLFDQSLRQSVAESHGGHVVELAKLSKTKHCDEKIEELIGCFKDAWCLKYVNRFTKYFDQAARLSRDTLRSAPEINCFELLGVCAVNVEVYQIPLERFWWNVLCGLSLRQDQIYEYWLHVARFTIVKFLYNTNALVYSILPCIVVGYSGRLDTDFIF